MDRHWLKCIERKGDHVKTICCKINAVLSLDCRLIVKPTILKVPLYTHAHTYTYIHSHIHIYSYKSRNIYMKHRFLIDTNIKKK